MARCYSGAMRQRQPLPDEDAREDVCGGPEDAARDIDENEERLAHAQHADDARHHGLHAWHEATDGNGLAAMIAHEVLALGDKSGIAAQRPVELQAVTE